MTTTKESLEQIKKYLCAGNPVWDVDKVSAVMDEAIEAVEKRTVPRKPTIRTIVIDEGFQPTEMQVYVCGNCGLDLGAARICYCPYCGQRIDWRGYGTD